MRAIVQDVYGSADVLRFGEVERPVPGDDEVLVQVRAAGVDRSVWHLMTGLPYLGRLAFGTRKPKNPVRGADGAGVVEAVGAKVTRFKAGDEVFGVFDGSFAEYARAKERKLAPKPVNLTFEQAAVIPISGLTALQALRGKGRPEQGQEVLVIGASGGVGMFAVQLAAAYGARVTGVCGPAKADLVRSLGAAEVIDYTQAEITGRYDIILDIAGNRGLSHLRGLLNRGGTLIIMGGEGGGRWLGDIDRQLRAVLLSPFVRQNLRSHLSAERYQDLLELKELAEDGTITPAIDRSYPLADGAAAVRYLAEGRVRGKVVLTV